LLEHLHVLADGEDEVKTIGIYASAEDARAAVERLKNQPGFRDHPRIVIPEVDAQRNGFHISS